MQLSLFYFTYFLLILLSTADQAEFNNPCPTSRRLLFFGGFNFPLGEKKSEPISSSSKSSSSSSPSKHPRTENAPGLTIYIRPQTSSELGHKVRSYSHLLKPKLYTKEERANLKKAQSEKKKQHSLKKKNSTQHKPSISTKSQELVAINDEERDRCRALLRIDQQPNLIPTKEVKKTKKEKKSISSKIKNATSQAKKKVAAAAKALPINDKQKSKKVKPTKNKPNPTPTEKKKSSNKPSETQPLTPPLTNEVPIKKSSPPPPPSPLPPPTTSSQSSTNTKSKRDRQPPVIEETVETLNINEADDIDNDEKNNSVVGRAYHFVKNMFQLSDDILENNHTEEEDQILSSTNEQQQRYQSRKLLTIDHQLSSIIYNDYEFDLHLNQFDHLSSSAVGISKRQLLSVKANKNSISSKKEKKPSSDTNKPKVGWAYRYRISRYLDDQKMKRTGHANKATGGGKSKQQEINSKQNNKKTSNSKFSKRKLLELDSDDDESSLYNDEISDQDMVNSVSITEQFVPKRQLLSSKPTVKVEEENDNEEEEDSDKSNERRRMKSYEALTDPASIVHSYDQGLFKPRVGWQFRYRVSRYIDSLRENIREDQQRLKLGLQAIKRKTPQELSGRRKRVLDKPFTPEPEETPITVEDNKPNVGWRYRYRISKMLEAKRRGDYIDDDEEKRKARLDQKKKPSGVAKPSEDDENCLEWEFDLDPELRKINEEGKRVGWAYRYRIRRKLDELKQKQTDTGIPFDLETLGGKRDKKVLTTTKSPTVVPDEKSAEANKKTVGWQYRYRVSKMREAQKLESAEALSKSTSKKHDQIPVDERLDPVLARLKPDDRIVGWQYRYRIRRKLDAINNTTRETEGGKRGKKPKQSSKQKEKEKIIKTVEESIEKILNIDDIDETPFMEYFRRSSSYVLFGLVPAARKSICLLPLQINFSFCNDDDEEDIEKTITTTEIPKQTSTKKLRTKKEKRAKQFINSRSSKLDTTNGKIDEPVKPLSKTPTTKTKKPQKKEHPQRIHPTIRRHNNEQIKHFNEEEEPVKKLIGVESKKNKNKKRFQIIGKEVKIKHKHSTTPPTPTITTVPPPILTLTPPTPITTTTNPPPIVATPSPVVEVPKTTPPPPREPEIILPKTTSPPLRSISEVIQEEASTLLSTNPTSSPEETKEEINEANENIPVTPTTKTTPPILYDSTTSGEENNDSTSTDSESSSSDSDSSSNEETEEGKEDHLDSSPLKKIKQFYENTKESVHGVFDLNDDKDSS